MNSQKNNPAISDYFSSRKPSSIRQAQIEFEKRKDGTKAINVAIGNVSLPMHPAMQKRLFNLGNPSSPFKNGVVKYSSTVGLAETNQAVLNIIQASGFNTNNLYTHITDGGSFAMELVVLGVCGPGNKEQRPLLLIDPNYANYSLMTERVGSKAISIQRTLTEDGAFAFPKLDEIENYIMTHHPSGLVLIPYDNPTGSVYSQQILVDLCRLCVKHNLWIVSDEAYRELCYTGDPIISVWGVTEADVPGITGHRISIETASKVWNACGLRIGALVTDNPSFHQQAVAEATANLCASAIGQYIFGALAHESTDQLQTWFNQQRSYYKNLMQPFFNTLLQEIPGIIVSKPAGAIYTVIDVRNLVNDTFNSEDFAVFCAQKGQVMLDSDPYTLLTSPMIGFYNVPDPKLNPGRTQMRVSFVESEENMKKVPHLLKELLNQYQSKKTATTQEKCCVS